MAQINRTTRIAAAMILTGATVQLASAQAVSPPSPTDAPTAAATTPPLSIPQQINNLHWTVGPANVAVAGIASLNVPQGAEMLAPPDSETFLSLNGNPVNPDQTSDYIIMPVSASANWFAEMHYENNGHIADDQKIDADALLKQMQQNSIDDDQARQQQHLPSLDLIGWGSQPVYDQQTHRLQWSFQYQSSDGTKTENLNTRLLSRTGDMHIIMVDDPDDMKADIPAFNQAIAGLNFNSAETYADYHSGDRLAQYGLTGLIAGGAAAVAVKTGLLATVLAVLAGGGKILLAGVFAVIAFGRTLMKKIFRRPRS